MRHEQRIYRHKNGLRSHCVATLVALICDEDVVGARCVIPGQIDRVALGTLPSPKVRTGNGGAFVKMQPVSIGVTWVKFGVWTENPEQAKGPEKRARWAVKKNGMNMVYSSIIQGQEEGGKGGRTRRNPGKPKINECKREVCYPLLSPSAVIVSNASEVASI